MIKMNLKITSFLKQLILIPILWLVIFSNYNCGDAPPPEKVKLTIVLSDKLSDNADDNFPQEFQKLCYPLEGKCKSIIISPVKITRLDLSVSIKLPTDSIGINDEPNNLNGRKINVDNFFRKNKTGKVLSRIWDETLNADSLLNIFLISQIKDSANIYIFSNDDNIEEYRNFKVYNSIDKIREMILNKYCNESFENIIVIYNLPKASKDNNTKTGLVSENKTTESNIKSERKTQEKTNKPPAKQDPIEDKNISPQDTKIINPESFDVCISQNGKNFIWSNLGDKYKYHVQVFNNEGVSILNTLTKDTQFEINDNLVGYGINCLITIKPYYNKDLNGKTLSFSLNRITKTIKSGDCHQCQE